MELCRTATGMNTPRGLAFDSATNRLFVAGTTNSRVLVFDVTAIADCGPAAWWDRRKLPSIVAHRVYPEVRRISLPFFLLGAAFMLIELRIVTELALLFGST
jgi:hypothetical protein